MEEIVRKIPTWLVAIALAVFVGMLGHSLFISGKPFQMFGQQWGAIAEAGSTLPAGTVVAFDTPDACPEGWSPFAEAQSRTVVGATFGTGFVTGLGVDEGREPLTEYKYRQRGGEEMATLTAEQVPSHFHALKIHYAYNFASGTSAFILTGRDGPVEEGDASKWTFFSDYKSPRRNELSTTETVGGDQPHNNIPPYIALYFCKKD